MYSAIILPIALFFLFRLSCIALPPEVALQGTYKWVVGTAFLLCSSIAVTTAIWGLFA